MKLRELMDIPGQLPWPLRFPSLDPRQVPTGRDYIPFLQARDVTGKGSIASDNPYSKCSTNSVPSHSGLEQRIQLACFFCPHILDIRAQYYYSDTAMDVRIANGYVPRRNELPTFDLMLTILSPWTKKIVYHVVAVKPDDLHDDQAVKRRKERDENACAPYGFTYELLGAKDFSDIECGNYGALFGHFRYQNLDACYVPARNFARLVNSSTAQGSADRVLGMVGKRFGAGLHDAYRLFAAAVFFGFVRLDMTRPFRPQKELVILSRRR